MRFRRILKRSKKVTAEEDGFQAKHFDQEQTALNKRGLGRPRMERIG